MNPSFQQSTNHSSAKRLAELATQLAKMSSDMVELASGLLTDSPVPNYVKAPRSATVSAASAPAPEQQRKPASKAEVIASVKAAREVIGQHNHPVPIGILFKEISARGYVVSTPRPLLTYGARLRDNRRTIGLTYLEGFGWWLVERPYLPANYAPSTISRIGKTIV
jgi:hypothetical protein